MPMSFGIHALQGRMAPINTRVAGSIRLTRIGYPCKWSGKQPDSSINLDLLNFYILHRLSILC